jgi:hypothetical protein
MFDWTLYSLSELNRGWKGQSLEIMIFVYVSSTWTFVELKTPFETWITNNVVNGVCLFHLYYLITLMAYLCSHLTPNDQINYYTFELSMYRLFVLNRCWKRDSQNNDIGIGMYNMQPSWIKNAFWDVNNKKWHKWCKFVSLFLYNKALPVLTMTPNVQIK